MGQGHRQAGEADKGVEMRGKLVSDGEGGKWSGRQELVSKEGVEWGIPRMKTGWVILSKE